MEKLTFKQQGPALVEAARQLHTAYSKFDKVMRESEPGGNTVGAQEVREYILVYSRETLEAFTHAAESINTITSHHESDPSKGGIDLLSTTMIQVGLILDMFFKGEWDSLRAVVNITATLAAQKMSHANVKVQKIDDPKDIDTIVEMIMNSVKTQAVRH